MGRSMTLEIALIILFLLLVCHHANAATKSIFLSVHNQGRASSDSVNILGLADEMGHEYSYPVYNGAKQGRPDSRVFPSRNSQAGLQGLMKQASSASIGVLFALLAWRALTAYEMASHFKNGMVRLLSISPSLVLLVMNLVGFLVNYFRPLGFKNYMKVILATNVSREWIELAYNFLMILVTDSTKPPSHGKYILGGCS